MSLEHEMERIGKIIAADNGIEVVCRGVDAYCTEDRRVVIPSIETYSWLGADAETMLHGLLDHETGHARDTDFSALVAAAPKGEAFKLLLNALEDGYVEGRQGNRYRGCAQNIAAKNNWFWTKGSHDKRPTPVVLKESKDPWSAFLLALTMVVRPFGGRTVADIEAVRPDVARMLRACEADWRGIAALIPKERASREVLKIAERIYERFQPPKKPKDESGSGGDVPALPGELEMELHRWTAPAEALTPEDAIRRKIHQVFDRDVHTQPYTNFDHAFDLERDFSSENLAKTSTQFAALEVGTREASDALVLTFEASLRALRLRRRVSGFDEGDVDHSLLSSFAVGAESADVLYQQHVADDDRTVAVAILIDCSGSMAGSKAHLATQTAIAMSRALAACGIVHEVTGFTCVDAYGFARHGWVDDSSAFKAQVEKTFRAFRAALIEAKEHGTDVSGFAREVPNGQEKDLSTAALVAPIHATFKSFSSDDLRGITRVAGIHENLDGEAVIWQARRLAARPEQRRVMFVLSDGYPAGSRDNAQGQRYLKDVVRRVIDAGIEIYGIGIESSAVTHFYPQSWVVEDVEDLAKIAMSGMTEVLTENRQERQWVDRI